MRFPALAQHPEPHSIASWLARGRRYAAQIVLVRFVDLQSAHCPGGGEPCSAEMDAALRLGCAVLPSCGCSGGLSGVLLPPETLSPPGGTRIPLLSLTFAGAGSAG